MQTDSSVSGTVIPMLSLADLPACPVETTLTLISDKWKVLILRDLMPGTKRFGELKKSIGLPESPDFAATPDGGERTSDKESVRGGPAARGIYPDRPRLQPETDHGRHVDVG